MSAGTVIAEILSTGEEIRTGALTDTNAGYIAERLRLSGIHVARIQALGDDKDLLVKVFREIGDRADIALVTGGLGPTMDDLSTEAAAAAASVGLKLDNGALRSIEAFFASRQRVMPPSNRKQASVPEGAEILPNPVGTAPGFSFVIGRCRFYFMPGVPHEMRRMLADQVIPRIEKTLPAERPVMRMKTLSCFGLAESETGERVAALADHVPGVQVGLRAKFPEIQVKLYTSGTDGAVVDGILAQGADWVRSVLGDHLFSEDESEMAAVVGALLKKKAATLALAESCTGGLIASRVTDVAGSSDFFLMSAVTYANDAKIGVLGVSPETLERHGAVSIETASEMAAGARRVAGATYGLSTSGIAGPDGGSAEKPVGTVCIGLATPDGVRGYRFVFRFGKRSMNKTMFAMKALDLLRRELMD